RASRRVFRAFSLRSRASFLLSLAVLLLYRPTRVFCLRWPAPPFGVPSHARLLFPLRAPRTGVPPSLRGRPRLFRSALRRTPPQVRRGLFPFRSPLLRKSVFVSFPPRTDMLKFCGSPHARRPFRHSRARSCALFRLLCVLPRADSRGVPSRRPSSVAALLSHCLPSHGNVKHILSAHARARIDPSAGSPTETLLRLLSNLGTAAHARTRLPRAPISDSDGRCVQKTGTLSPRAGDPRVLEIPCSARGSARASPARRSSCASRHSFLRAL
ncbi:hypothetical protein NEPAR06_2546, partial [Nematocida parisii]